jgi:endonuclease YncB( thermonuclease family)
LENRLEMRGRMAVNWYVNSAFSPVSALPDRLSLRFTAPIAGRAGKARWTSPRSDRKWWIRPLAFIHPACFFLFCACNFAHAEKFCELPPCSGIPARTFSAKVIAVLDGDTVLVQRGARSSQPVKVRLDGIDAPEKEQPYGMASRQSLSELVWKKQVQVGTQAVDDYGRMIAHLTVDGRNVNEEQIRRGMAWEYSRHHGNKAYAALESGARQARLGLWSQAEPMPPWQWRKAHAATRPPHAATQGFSCGTKRYCTQMASCDEAHFYLTHCGVKALDGDGNGVPCESLCTRGK